MVLFSVLRDWVCLAGPYNIRVGYLNVEYWWHIDWLASLFRVVEYGCAAYIPNRRFRISINGTPPGWFAGGILEWDT